MREKYSEILVRDSEILNLRTKPFWANYEKNIKGNTIS